MESGKRPWEQVETQPPNPVQQVPSVPKRLATSHESPGRQTAWEWGEGRHLSSQQGKLSSFPANKLDQEQEEAAAGASLGAAGQTRASEKQGQINGVPPADS